MHIIPMPMTTVGMDTFRSMRSRSLKTAHSLGFPGEPSQIELSDLPWSTLIPLLDYRHLMRLGINTLRRIGLRSTLYLCWGVTVDQSARCLKSGVESNCLLVDIGRSTRTNPLSVVNTNQLPGNYHRTKSNKQSNIEGKAIERRPAQSLSVINNLTNSFKCREIGRHVISTLASYLRFRLRYLADCCFPVS